MLLAMGGGFAKGCAVPPRMSDDTALPMDKRLGEVGRRKEV